MLDRGERAGHAIFVTSHALADEPDRAAAPPRLGVWLIWAGIAALGIPVLIDTATRVWSTEQGSYGGILLALGIWLVWRRWPAMREHGSPGNAALGGLVLAGALAVHVIARMMTNVSGSALTLYAALVAAGYLLVGFRGLRAAAFPLCYGLIAMPLPPSLIASVTTQLRLGITDAATTALRFAGLPVGREGLDIQVAQYRIAVAEACSGLNSIIGLAAIGFFYVYIRRTPLRLPVVVATLAVVLGFAILANFIRVVLVISVTYYFGDAVAQGPLHEGAGFLMFAIALGGVMAVDALAPDYPRVREVPA